jgi:hypothetical protein
MSDLHLFEKFKAEDLVRELKSRYARGSSDATSLSVKRELHPDLEQFDSAMIAVALRAKQKVIYGVDNRLDLFEVISPTLRQDSDSVVSLIRDTHLSDNGDGTSTLQTVSFRDSQRLCASERFGTQPVAAFCTGVLIGPDLVATAGHCVKESDMAGVRFVFGFRMIDVTHAQTTIANTEIYATAAIVGRTLTPDASDWCVVRLDRAVSNHRVAPIRRVGKIADDQMVHVIGHPSGLPIKVAGDANVRSNSEQAFFVANLDTYGGNSGSPVFNSVSHEVEGILVRGDTDFVPVNGCFVSQVCPNQGCRGEDCTRVSEFLPRVP